MKAINTRSKFMFNIKTVNLLKDFEKFEMV